MNIFLINNIVESSRTGVPGWETGTTAVSQPGQINVFVVVGGPYK